MRLVVCLLWGFDFAGICFCTSFFWASACFRFSLGLWFRVGL